MSSEEREVSSEKNDGVTESNQSTNDTAPSSSVGPVNDENASLNPAPAAPSPSDSGKKRSRDKDEGPQEKSAWEQAKDKQKKQKKEPEGPNAHVKALSVGEQQLTSIAHEMGELQYRAAMRLADNTGGEISRKWTEFRQNSDSEQNAEQNAELTTAAEGFDENTALIDDETGAEMMEFDASRAPSPSPSSLSDDDIDDTDETDLESVDDAKFEFGNEPKPVVESGAEPGGADRGNDDAVGVTPSADTAGLDPLGSGAKVTDRLAKGKKLDDKGSPLSGENASVEPDATQNPESGTATPTA